MKNSDIRLVQQDEDVEYSGLSFLDSGCSTKRSRTEKIIKVLNVVKEIIYYAGAPIADDVIEQPYRSERRR
ncbi:MAG: hypothetical protein IK137_01295 [Bacilli bacterium]|nr:hypothetical protein [Bacilli bacterium]